MKTPTRYKTLRIRLAPDEWEYLAAQKAKGQSYNNTIRRALANKIKVKTPF